MQVFGKDQFHKLRAPLDQVLSDKNLQPADIDIVIPVGGSSKIPRVLKELKDLFPNASCPSNFDPESAVVKGAALCAEYLEEDPKALPMDVTPISLGVAEMKENSAVGDRPGAGNVEDQVLRMSAFSPYVQVSQGTSSLDFVLDLSPLQSGTTGTSVPNDVFLVADVSGSMGGQKLQDLKDATKRIVQSMPPSTRIYVCTFGSSACHHELRLSYATDDVKAEAIQLIDSFAASGGTNMVAGLQRAVQVVKERPDSNTVATVVALTDGHPNSKEPCTREVQQAMQTLGVHSPLSFHMIGFGDVASGSLDGPFLHALAEVGRGRYYYAKGLNLADVMGDLVKDAQSVQAQQVGPAISGPYQIGGSSRVGLFFVQELCESKSAVLGASPSKSKSGGIFAVQLPTS